MSTIDPELRWWRSGRILRVSANVLWVIVFATAFITGWSNAVYLAGAEWTHWAGANWLTDNGDVSAQVAQMAQTSLVVVMWPIVAAGFLDGYARHRAGGGEAWALATAFGVTLSGLGLGTLVAAFTAGVGWYWPALFLLGGVACLAARPVSRRLLSEGRSRQDLARVQGAAAQAVVTKVDLVIIRDVPRWKLTLRYDDHTGQTRWHTASTLTRGTKPLVGERYQVRYDPSHPGRRSSIYVNLSTPQNASRRR